MSTDLVGQAGVAIPASAVDVRLVKCWYQAGRNVWETDKRILVPELLLKDDDLVRVDLKSKQNFIRVNIAGKARYIEISTPGATIPDRAITNDAKYILPFDLPANFTKQVWLTVKVPPQAPAGVYSGSILLVDSENGQRAISIEVQVLPFDLDPAILEYALYYRGKVTYEPFPGIGSEWKTPMQYRVELEDIRAHGVSYPTIYQPYDPVALTRALEIRDDVGLPKDRLYVLGMGTGNPADVQSIRLLGEKVARWKRVATGHGYHRIYIYGIDEAKGKRLSSQRAAWERVHQEGAGVFTACHEGDWKLVGNLLDVAVLSGPFKSEDVRAWHSLGKRVLIYSNPQAGVEDARIYRENYGYRLWMNGYDGAMDYAYQHGFSCIWNDFDNERYRDHVFAYPTTDGVIDTIQWEGFREAVDDVRYLSTYLNGGYKIRDLEAPRRIKRVFGTLDAVTMREEITAKLSLGR